MKSLLTSPVVAAVLLVVGCAVLTMHTGSAQQVWLWSQTAGTNSNVDPTINWAEGMAPSAVNDSARSMMAGIAKARDDWSGATAAAGTATAFTVTSNQGFGSLANLNNQQICFTPGTTNGAGVTLSVDNLTAEPINSAPSTPVGAGVMVAGTPYCVVYSNSSLAFLLRSAQGNPFNVPLGTVLDYTGDSAPNSNFALAYGQCISRTTYATYFALVATRFSNCDGVTTFGLPDLRGFLTAGLDNMGGTAANRITLGGSGINGAVVGGAGGSQNETISQAQLPAVNFQNSGITVSNPSTFTVAANNTSISAGSASLYSVNAQPTVNVTTNVSLGAIITNQGHASSGGSGTALTTMPPTFMVNKIVRIF